MSWWLITIIIVILLITGFIAYGAYWAVSTGVDCLADPIKCVFGGASDVTTILTKKPSPLQCPDNMQNNKVGLCLKKCPEGYKWDGAQLCYKECPTGWAGGSSLTHCQKKTIYSTVGTQGANKLCPTGKVNSAGLCYTLPDSSWHVTAPGFIGKKCPADAKDSGTTCWYDRGVGKIPPATCPADRELHGGLCYTKCPAGSRRTAAMTCDFGPYGGVKTHYSIGKLSVGDECLRWGPEWHKTALWTCQKGGIITNAKYGGSIMPTRTCPAGQVNQAGLCYPAPRPGYDCTLTHCKFSKNVKAQVGTIPDVCPPGRELGPGIGNARLCYPKCSDGYVRQAGNLEMCSLKCPTGYLDIGIGGCQKPRETLPVAKSILEVGVCPAGKKKVGGLCYDA